MEKREIIREFIKDKLMNNKGSLGDDQSLFESGIVDSMDFLILLDFIEKNFNIPIKMSEISIDNFNTIQKIADFIAKKSSKKR